MISFQHQFLVSHPLLNLKLVEANLEKDEDLKIIRDLILNKDTLAREKIRKLKHGLYLASYFNTYSVAENCLWMNGKLAIPASMTECILNRLHFSNHGRDAMYSASKDVWFPMIEGNISAIAKYCKKCLAAGKILSLVLKKS